MFYLTVDECIVFIGRDVSSRLGLAEQGHDSLAGVAAHDGNGSLRGVLFAGVFLGESLGTDDIKGGDTKEAFGIEDVGSLQDFGGNGDGGVHWVGDDENRGLGAEFCDSLDQSLDNSRIDLEEIITGHSRLPCSISVMETDRCWDVSYVDWVEGFRTGDSGRDDNNVGTGESVLQTIAVG